MNRTQEFAFMQESTELSETDPLSAARGFFFGIVLSLLLWALILSGVWWILK